MRLPPLVLLLLAVGPVMSGPVLAQENPDTPRRGNVLSVRGRAQHWQKPDTARIEIRVTTKGRTLDGTAQAHQERTPRAYEILKALESSGVTIEKSTFRLNEEQRGYPTPANPNPKVPDLPFTAMSDLTLKLTAVDAVNPTVTRLVGSGLFEVLKVTFSVEADRQALNEARRAAVLDAREQARIYAEAADLKLVEITEIADGEATPPEGYADLPRSARIIHIIPPAAVDFSASVTIRWRIAPR
ncbi:SIMPL domain-containing protein [Methylobacterium sp. ID0610]|uniref:SIMPL domain-containing protein n=1 Tax=Methylobacterium carpenticola TaxID=3344827 RepID=UPI00369E6BCB